jgi:hypothetical protein
VSPHGWTVKLFLRDFGKIEDIEIYPLSKVTLNDPADLSATGFGVTFQEGVNVG